jgi:biopolymer transport protein TolR
MAMMFGPRRGGAFGPAGRRQTRPMSEINVTPLVDVMLVLLVIFMVTAPLLTTGVQVDLPKGELAQVSTGEEPLAVTVTKAGKIYLGDREVSLDVLIAQAKATAANNPEARVFVRGDAAIAYGQVMAVIAAIHNAGVHKVALLTQPEGPPTRQRAALP